jgi:hypothetical protein
LLLEHFLEDRLADLTQPGDWGHLVVLRQAIDRRRRGRRRLRRKLVGELGVGRLDVLGRCARSARIDRRSFALRLGRGRSRRSIEKRDASGWRIDVGDRGQRAGQVHGNADAGRGENAQCQ